MMTFSLKLRLVWLASGSRASSSWLVIANELKSWLSSARYHNEPSRAESSQPRAERANELRIFRPALQPCMHAGLPSRRLFYMAARLAAARVEMHVRQRPRAAVTIYCKPFMRLPAVGTLKDTLKL
jgi:hypothetical protein